MFKFKIANITVKSGDWIYAQQQLGTTLYAKVCDDKFEGGCMVYWYNTVFPEGHEAGWLSAEQAESSKRVPTWAQSQFDSTEHGQAANEFYQDALAVEFQ